MIEQLGHQLLKAAIKNRCSDIYIQPKEDHYQVLEHRSDGIHEVQQLPDTEGQQLITHFKYRANMAITETRRPQMGALTLEISGITVHLRLSSVGNFINQESLVVRLLLPLDIQRPEYLVPGQLDTLADWCRHRGLVLFAGPTGSGKTTTIYQLAKVISHNLSVLSIEDPVEIVEPAFLQLQVNDKAEMTYQALIKVALRHRPDVLIIGEIRDAKTAKAAVDAALSGHLVLSTIHAQTAKGTVTRLTQLGVDFNAIKQAVTGVAYQRLLPKLNGQTVALLDLQAGPVNQDWLKDTTMSVEWRKILEDASSRKQISSTTKRTFQTG